MNVCTYVYTFPTSLPSIYLTPILASLFTPSPPSLHNPFRLHLLSHPTLVLRNFFLGFRIPPPLAKPAAVFISSRVRRVTAKWRKRRQEKHKELGGARKNEGSFFLPMNKGVLIRHVRERDKGEAAENERCMSAKSKRERPTMGRDTWKEEKVGNRK